MPLPEPSYTKCSGGTLILGIGAPSEPKYQGCPVISGIRALRRRGGEGITWDTSCPILVLPSFILGVSPFGFGSRRRSHWYDALCVRHRVLSDLPSTFLLDCSTMRRFLLIGLDLQDILR